LDGSSDRFQNALPVGHHVVVIEAKNAKTSSNKKSVSAGVALLLPGFEMLTAIEFDNELCSVTNEINNVWADRGLAAKTRADHSMPS
jgi:hypothetical protein